MQGVLALCRRGLFGARLPVIDRFYLIIRLLSTGILDGGIVSARRLVGERTD